MIASKLCRLPQIRWTFWGFRKIRLPDNGRKCTWYIFRQLFQKTVFLLAIIRYIIWLGIVLIVMYCIVLYCNVCLLYCIVLHCIALHCHYCIILIIHNRLYELYQIFICIYIYIYTLFHIPYMHHIYIYIHLIHTFYSPYI